MPYLICRVRRRLSAIPLTRVIETMRVLPVEALPDAPPFLLGVALIRGLATPVIDVGALLNSAGDAALTRLVTVRAGERQMAIAVDEVVGVHDLPASSLEEASSLIHEVSGGAIAAIGRLGGRLLMVLETARMVPESVWSAIKGGRA